MKSYVSAEYVLPLLHCYTLYTRTVYSVTVCVCACVPCTNDNKLVRPECVFLVRSVGQ